MGQRATFGPQTPLDKADYDFITTLIQETIDGLSELVPKSSSSLFTCWPFSLCSKTSTPKQTRHPPAEATQLLRECLMYELCFWFRQRARPHRHEDHLVELGQCMEYIYEFPKSRTAPTDKKHMDAVEFIRTNLVDSAITIEISVDVVFAIVYRASLMVRDKNATRDTRKYRFPSSWEKCPNPMLEDLVAMMFMNRAFVLPKVADEAASGFHWIRFQLEHLLQCNLMGNSMPDGPFVEGKVVSKCRKHFVGVEVCPTSWKESEKYKAKQSEISKHVEMKDFRAELYRKYDWGLTPPGYEDVCRQ